MEYIEVTAREKQEEPEVNSVETPKKSEAPVHAEKKFEKKADDFKKAEPKKEFKSEPKKEFKKEHKPADNHKNAEVKEAPKVEAQPQPKEEPFTAEQKEVIKKDIKEFLNNMFGAMSMEVKADITFDDEENSVNVDLSGDNMGVLIGKRGENYRKRRKETLESLAKNIAYKVKRSRRPVSLEPMNPYERRIIHSALQADKFVSTRSEGEEPFRHVVVYLERENNNRYNR